jgi:hypothetical protein
MRAVRLFGTFWQVLSIVNGQVEVPAGGQIKVPTPCGDF